VDTHTVKFKVEIVTCILMCSNEILHCCFQDLNIRLTSNCCLDMLTFTKCDTVECHGPFYMQLFLAWCGFTQ
jgi:hypothetical protein